MTRVRMTTYAGHNHSRDETSPRVWNDPGGCHFNPYFDKKEMERKAHERGLEKKRARAMFPVQHSQLERERHGQVLRKVPVTLPKLKFLDPAK